MTAKKEQGLGKVTLGLGDVTDILGEVIRAATAGMSEIQKKLFWDEVLAGLKKRDVGQAKRGDTVRQG